MKSLRTAVEEHLRLLDGLRLRPDSPLAWRLSASVVSLQKALDDEAAMFARIEAKSREALAVLRGWEERLDTILKIDPTPQQAPPPAANCPAASSQAGGLPPFTLDGYADALMKAKGVRP